VAELDAMQAAMARVDPRPLHAWAVSRRLAEARHPLFGRGVMADDAKERLNARECLNDGALGGVHACDPALLPESVRGWARARIREHGPALWWTSEDADEASRTHMLPNVAGLWHLRDGAVAQLPGTRGGLQDVPRGWRPRMWPYSEPAILITETLPDAWAATVVAREWGDTDVLCVLSPWDWRAWGRILAQRSKSLRAAVVLSSLQSADLDRRLEAMDRCGRQLAAAGIDYVRPGWGRLMGAGSVPAGATGLGDWVAAVGAPVVALHLAAALRGDARDAA
jgi:hypothetical protein